MHSGCSLQGGIPWFGMRMLLLIHGCPPFCFLLNFLGGWFPVSFGNVFQVREDGLQPAGKILPLYFVDVPLFTHAPPSPVVSDSLLLNLVRRKSLVIPGQYLISLFTESVSDMLVIETHAMLDVH